MIDVQKITDRIKAKAAEPPEEESAETETETPPGPKASPDVHLGEAFDALKSGNREAFIQAMNACLSSGYTPPVE